MKIGEYVILIAILTFGLTIMTKLSFASEAHRNQYPSGTVQLQPSSEVQETAAVMNKMTLKEHVQMYWKFFFEKGDKVPRMPLPQEKLAPLEITGLRGKGLKASWLGHSSVLMNIDGASVLTDPVFERKVSVVGPGRFNRELVLDSEDLPHVDVVIISHDHYDHLNKFSIRQLADKTDLFVVPLRVGRYLKKCGVAPAKIVELDWWEEATVNDKMTIVATPSQHFSGRTLFDKNRTLWASWVVKTEKHRVFFSGDTGYFKGLKDIGEKFGPFDVTFLECGAYNSHWSNIHMLPEETAQAFIDLKGRILQPIHWATFNLALHAWYEPIERLMARARTIGIDVSTPIMGRVVDYEAPPVTSNWWLPAMNSDKRKEDEDVADAGLMKNIF